MTEKKKIIILILLAIFAVISLFYGITTSLKTRHKEAPPALDSAGGAERVLTVERQAKRTDYVSWGRNPFSLRQVSGGLILNGILWDEEKPVAIVNDIEVIVGDKIEGSEVIEIKPQSVILNNGSENFELKLWAGE